MKLIVVNSICGAKKYFDALTPEHSFQSYAVQCAIEKSFMRGWYYSAIKRPWRFVCHVPRFKSLVVVDDSGKTILLAALRLLKCSGWCFCSGETHGSTADYIDFIYGDASDVQKQDALRMVFDWLAKNGFGHLRFEQIVATSQTIKHFETIGVPHDVKKETLSVYINLGVGTHEQYFAALGKHAKQNVRTAYNRMTRDNHTCRFSFYSRSGIGLAIDSADGRSVIEQCERLYCDRQNSRYSHTRTKFAQLKKWYAQQIVNYTTLAKDSPDLILAVLYIDNEIAAFMRGYFKHDRSSIELPRLAINEKFGWYSPGLVMLNETAKFFLSSTNVRGIDLCRGTEKYKLDMGGGTYPTKTITVRLGGAK